MKMFFRVVAPVLLGLCIVSVVVSAVTQAKVQAKHYICVPCGLPCDARVFDQPGTCSQCGMALVEQGAALAAAAARKKVAILIFDGVEIIDYTGPYEVFGVADFDVYTVAASNQPVSTAMGMKVIPQYTFANAPQPDVLVVPGGGISGAQGSAATLKWVRDVTAKAQHTMSVCNGAFILASAGLLDGLKATTTYSNLQGLKTQFPKIGVVSDQRFVDNGKIITTAGLSAGIDGALHVVARMLGDGDAEQVALMEEYDWHPRSGFARGALADRLIPNVNADAIGKWKIVSTEGGTDRWEMVFRGTSKLSAAELMNHLGGAFVTQGKWTSVKTRGGGSSSPMESDWRFSELDGRAWTGTLTIQTMPGPGRQYTVKLNIARAG